MLNNADDFISFLECNVCGNQFELEEPLDEETADIV